MSKQSRRRRIARMIRANDKRDFIQFNASGVDWIKAAEGEDTAKPKRFSMKAYTGGAMVVGYYDAPVVIDLAGLSASAPLPILMDHDPAKIVGHADTVDVSAQSLNLAGVVSGASVEANQVIASAGMGFPWKASVGARPEKMEFFDESTTTKVNGKTFKGPVYVARKATLGEVSFVAMAADGKTSAKVAARAAYIRKETVMEFEAWVQALGFDVATLTDQQTAALQAKFDAESKPVVNATGKEPVKAITDKPVFDLSGVILAYEKHVATVQAKAAEYTGKIESTKLAEIQSKAGQRAAELKAKALEDEWVATKLEVELIKAQADTNVELIRAERPKAATIHGSTRDASPEIMQCAMCMTAGLPGVEKKFKPEVLEAASRIGGLGLQEYLLMAAQAGGYDGGRMAITPGNLRPILQAAFSTHSVTTMISDLGHKFLLSGFEMAPQTWREVATTRSVGDFKQTTAYRLTTDLEYERLAPAGEIKHGTFGQDSYTMQARTYAKMLTLTREDIINDDLGAFDDLRRRLGLGAGLAMEKLFWTVWLAAKNGAAFWTEARGNLVTGSAFGETGLTAALKAFRNLKTPDGGLMNLNPTKVLVPTSLEATALKWRNSAEIRDTTASTKTPTSNIYQNRFAPVVVPQLENSNFTGYSATTWWMLPDPAILASAVVSFLNGVQTPVVESADADFNVLGIQLRGYHDFGVDMSEYLASVQANA